MDLVHVEREKESLSAELSARKQELETTRQLMENQRAEERKLRKIISEASSERTRQKKELEQVGFHAVLHTPAYSALPVQNIYSV